MEFFINVSIKGDFVTLSVPVYIYPCMDVVIRELCTHLNNLFSHQLTAYNINTTNCLSAWSVESSHWLCLISTTDTSPFVPSASADVLSSASFSDVFQFIFLLRRTSARNCDSSVKERRKFRLKLFLKST